MVISTFETYGAEHDTAQKCWGTHLDFEQPLELFQLTCIAESPPKSATTPFCIAKILCS